MSDSDEPIDIADGGDDLFGDGGDDSDIERPLSDHELDEDDDDHRGADYDNDRRTQEIKDKRIMELRMFRHKIPKPKDDTLRILKIPDFIKIVPEEYKQDSYEPTASELAEDKKKVPASVIRWRVNPDTGKLESNANIYRWSDGSLSVAVGDQHYEIDVKSLAPPMGKPYDEKRDAHYYAAAGHLATEEFLTVGHITEELKVRPNAALEDAAVDQLMAKMDAATRHRHSGEDILFRTTEDPELRRKQAELAEKERERVRRKRENAAARMDLGVSGRSGGRGGGLSIGGLEGGAERAGGRRGKAAGAKPRQKRRNPEYDSDDDLPQGARRQDDYDATDGFIAPSDEEISEGQDDDDEDLLDDDDDEDNRSPPPSKRQKKSAVSDGDGDADGDVDDAPAAHADQGGRKNRRRVVDDDDE